MQNGTNREHQTGKALQYKGKYKNRTFIAQKKPLFPSSAAKAEGIECSHRQPPSHRKTARNSTVSPQTAKSHSFFRITSPLSRKNQRNKRQHPPPTHPRTHFLIFLPVFSLSIRSSVYLHASQSFYRSTSGVPTAYFYGSLTNYRRSKINKRLRGNEGGI